MDFSFPSGELVGKKLIFSSGQKEATSNKKNKDVPKKINEAIGEKPRREIRVNSIGFYSADSFRDKIRLRILPKWFISQCANFFYGNLLIHPLAHAYDYDSEGQCDVRQFFPLERGQTEAIERE